MEKSESESIEAAAKEICRQFKSLINTEDVETLKNLQLLIVIEKVDSPTLCYIQGVNVIDGVSLTPQLDIPNTDNCSLQSYFTELAPNTRDLVASPVRKLGRLQDSNAVLSHFNEYSEQCFAEIASDFSRNTRLLKSMKSDLDHIFQKLRSMKAKILKHYPDAFQEASASKIADDRPDLEIALSGKATL